MKVLNEQELKEKLADITPAAKTEGKQQNLSKKKIQNPDEDPEKDIKKYFLSLLARREYSKQELLAKAASRHADSSLAEKIIKELIEDNYQSDQRYAEMLLRARINKQVGPIKLRIELKQKGVSSDIIEQTLNSSDCDWFELAESCARKKYKALKHNADFQEKQKARAKLMRFLQGRGFDAEQIRYAAESVEKG